MVIGEMGLPRRCFIMEPKYKRVLLKVSGEVLAGDKKHGFDFDTVNSVCSAIKEMADLGIDFEGKPVKLIRYTYKEVDDEEEYKACFVGFEYKGTEDSGLFGLKIGSFEEDLSDDYIKDLFKQIFRLER